MATQATVSSGRYPAAMHALDAGIEVTQVACPDLVPLIQSGDTHGHELHEAAKTYAAPLKRAGADTVILGCTHYPLIRQMLQRIYGRDVTLITSAEEIAREVAETLARRGVGNDPGREGDYRFLCTGDPAAFRDVARAVPPAPADRGRAGRPGDAAGGRMSRADGRGPEDLRTIEIEPDFIPSASGSALFTIGSTRLICTAMVEESVPPWMRGRGTRLGHVRVRDAAGVDVGAEVARREPRPRRRAHGRDPAPGRPVAALGGRLQGAGRAHGVDRLRRHPGRRRHPLRSDLRRLRRHAHGAPAPGRKGRAAAGAAARLGRGRLGRDRRLRAAARPALRRGQPRRGGHERGDDRKRRADRGAGHRRAHAVRPGVARPAARAGRGRHRDDRPRAGAGAAGA